MPTLTDYERAASLFAEAAAEALSLVQSAPASEARSVLQGGRLSSQVPAAIEAAAAVAASCHGDLLDAERICLERASTIAEYLDALAHYDELYTDYAEAAAEYHRDYDAWYYSNGALAHPGYPPTPPVAPVAPPEWADVRRLS